MRHWFPGSRVVPERFPEPPSQGGSRFPSLKGNRRTARSPLIEKGVSGSRSKPTPFSQPETAIRQIIDYAALTCVPVRLTPGTQEPRVTSMRGPFRSRPPACFLCGAGGGLRAIGGSR